MLKSVFGLVFGGLLLVGCAGPQPESLWGTEGVGTVYNIGDAPVAYVEGALSSMSSETSAHTPVPGHGDALEYVKARFNSNRNHIYHGGHTLKYLFLNTNASTPPYEEFGSSVQRDWTNIQMTADTFLFDFDWDDPFTH